MAVDYLLGSCAALGREIFFVVVSRSWVVRTFVVE